METTSLIKSEYAFIVSSGQDWLVGTQPAAIIQNWSELQRYIGTHWLIGFIGYEQGYELVKPTTDSVLWTSKSDDIVLPNVFFGAFDTVSIVRPADLVQQFSASGVSLPLLKLRSNMTADQYASAFQTIQAHIRAGDIYQANLTHRLSGSYAGTPLDLFLRLYARQPTLYGGFVRTPEFAVVSNSPELFLQIQNNRAETRPMKGTRSRGESRQTDARLREELSLNEKENAELDMIIDIHRNDLARTALPSSVRVLEQKRIRPLTTVWQAEAVIQSQIDPRYSVLDVIAGCFPAGSVTGAPKIRAMEILHELEPARRNVYTGAMGYIDPKGNAQLNVAIRTAILQNDMIHYSVGGGIVFDSNCQAEYEESLAKAKTLLM